MKRSRSQLQSQSRHGDPWDLYTHTIGFGNDDDNDDDLGHQYPQSCDHEWRPFDHNRGSPEDQDITSISTHETIARGSVRSSIPHKPPFIKTEPSAHKEEEEDRKPKTQTQTQINFKSSKRVKGNDGDRIDISGIGNSNSKVVPQKLIAERGIPQHVLKYRMKFKTGTGGSRSEVPVRDTRGREIQGMGRGMGSTAQLHSKVDKAYGNMTSSPSQSTSTPRISSTSLSTMAIEGIDYIEDTDYEEDLELYNNSSAPLHGHQGNLNPPVPTASQNLNLKTSHLPPLSAEQNLILQRVLAGHNTFFTGSAGTGKSLIIDHLKAHFEPGECSVTAPTGIAAVLIGGATIHSWAGVGKCKGGLTSYLQRFKKQEALGTPESSSDSSSSSASIGSTQSGAAETTNEKPRENWRNTKVLIVDEVSMIHPDLFGTLDAIGKSMRGYDPASDKAPAFGGIQVVLAGDFYQLPPVESERERTCYMCGTTLPGPKFRECLPRNHPLVMDKLEAINHTALDIDSARWSRCLEVECHYLYNDTISYIFQTPTWKTLGLHSPRNKFLLKEIFRQKDAVWAGILEKIKVADFRDVRTRTYVLGLIGRGKSNSASNGTPMRESTDGGTEIDPTTKLFTHRSDVHQENILQFNKLDTEIYTYNAVDGGSVHKYPYPRPSPTTSNPWAGNSTAGISTGPIHKPYAFFGSGSEYRPLTTAELDKEPFFEDLQTPRHTVLREGSKVMLLSNIDFDAGLVNGSRGVIVGFEKFSKRRLILRFGSTCDDNSSKTPPGAGGKLKNPQASVSPNGTPTPPISELERYFHRNKVSVMGPSGSLEDVLILPWVRFRNLLNRTPPETSASGSSSGYLPPVLIPPTGWDQITTTIITAPASEYRSGSQVRKYKLEKSVHRTHIPLTLCWATTIHKSQGMTLDHLYVDLSRTFTAGQGYVGVSRCRTSAGLEIKLGDGGGGRESSKILIGERALEKIFMVDERVRRFYNSNMGSQSS